MGRYWRNHNIGGKLTETEIYVPLTDRERKVRSTDDGEFVVTVIRSEKERVQKALSAFIKLREALK